MQVGSLKPCMRFGKTEVVNSMYQTVEKGRPKALVKFTCNLKLVWRKFAMAKSA